MKILLLFIIIIIVILYYIYTIILMRNPQDGLGNYFRPLDCLSCSGDGAGERKKLQQASLLHLCLATHRLGRELAMYAAGGLCPLWRAGNPPLDTRMRA